jgi:dTDP-4-dehydrorhamnose 3,5-epimerase
MALNMTAFPYRCLPVSEIDGCWRMTQTIHEDTRGSLWTLWSEGINELGDQKFNLDKVSWSKKNVFRGLHGDHKSTKLVSILTGEVFFIMFDNRRNSNTYGNCYHEHIYPGQFFLMPPGVCNGYWVLSEGATFWYKWSFEGGYVDSDQQMTVKWTDPRLAGVPWPNKNPIVSPRDM